MWQFVPPFDDVCRCVDDQATLTGWSGCSVDTVILTREVECGFCSVNPWSLLTTHSVSGFLSGFRMTAVASCRWGRGCGDTQGDGTGMFVWGYGRSGFKVIPDNATFFC